MLFARVATLSDPGLTTSELVFSPSDAGRHAVVTESVPVGGKENTGRSGPTRAPDPPRALRAAPHVWRLRTSPGTCRSTQLRLLAPGAFVTSPQRLLSGVDYRYRVGKTANGEFAVFSWRTRTHPPSLSKFEPRLQPLPPVLDGAPLAPSGQRRTSQPAAEGVLPHGRITARRVHSP